MARKNSTSNSSGSNSLQKPDARRAEEEGSGIVPVNDEEWQELELRLMEIESRNIELRKEKQETAILLRKYIRLFDFAPFAYFVIDSNGLICDLNKKACALLGAEKNQLVVREFAGFISPSAEKEFTAWLASSFAGQAAESIEVLFAAAQGGTHQRLIAVNNPEEENSCRLIACEVEGKSAQDKNLKEELELFRSAFRKTPFMVLLIDPETESILDASSAAMSFFGFSPDDPANEGLYGVTPKVASGILSLNEVLASVKENPVVLKQQIATGEIRDLRFSFDPVRLDGREILYTRVEDITNKKRLEAVKKEQAFWRSESLNRSCAGTFEVDFVNDSWEVSGNLEKFLGVKNQTDKSIHGFLSLVRTDQRTGFQYYLFSEVIGRKLPFEKEFCIIRPSDRSECWLQGNAGLEFDDSGLVMKMTGTIRDITGQRRMQETLKESGERYRLLMNESPDGIVFFDTGGTILELSDLVTGQFRCSRECMTGQHFLRFIQRGERRKIVELINLANKSNYPQTAECRLVRQDNSGFIAEVSLTRIRETKDDRRAYIAVIRDITERKKREQQLIHLDRMAHLGEMATGMAHEINQPLNNISLALDNVFHEINLKDTLHDAYLKHKSDKIFDNIIKIKNLIEHIREFARDNHSYSLIPLDINEVISNALSVMLVRLDEERIDVVLDLDEKLNLFPGDSFKVEQVIMNLLLNAKDALNEKELKSPGTLSKIIRITSSQENTTICIEIKDNGIGIKSNRIDKIMDPFYTTKETGKGTGLGLSISYGIISGMNGRIEVESKYNEGTTFRVYLPIPEVS
jgi:PAS domain S-box-containing protein